MTPSEALDLRPDRFGFGVGRLAGGVCEPLPVDGGTASCGRAARFGRAVVLGPELAVGSRRAGQAPGARVGFLVARI